MPIGESRKHGVIVEYYPLRKTGNIAVGNNDIFLSFNCKHIRSDHLRNALCQSERFGKIDVCLHLAIPVAFTQYTDNAIECAGRIDSTTALSPNIDLARQSIGYIQFFGQDKEGKYYGWLNPKSDNANDDFSSYFIIDEVKDSVLIQYLKENATQGRAFWTRKQIKVKYWRVHEQRTKPSAWDVNLANENIRDKLRCSIGISVTNQSPSVEYSIKLEPVCQDRTVLYEDIATSPPPITNEEMQRLLLFRDEAIRIASNTPAIRNRITDLWKLVGQNSKQTLIDHLRSEEGLYGTRVAYILEAACSFLDRDYASVLQCCVNAQSFWFGIQVAKWYENWGIVQRMAEELFDDVQEEIMRILCEAAMITGNAEVLCGAFAEYFKAADEDDSLIDFCTICDEYARCLLDKKGIRFDKPDRDMLVSAVRNAYSAPLATLGELISLLKCNYEHSDCEHSSSEHSHSVVTNAADVEPKELPITYDGLKTRFREMFRLPDGQLRPISEINKDMVAILDRMLTEEAPDIGDYRIPLLIRLAYDPEGSRKHVQQYIVRLEDMAQRKRKSLQKDRRWRLFKALDAFLETGQGLEKAIQEAQGHDEPHLLNDLAARR